MRKEDHLATQISGYLSSQYPTIIYHFDTGSGSTTSIGMAMRNKRLNKWSGYPDLFIAEPRGKYRGLFIELKVESPFKKNGVSLKKNKHVEKQFELLQVLQKRGYFACFGVGFEQCKFIINKYLRNI
jgi:hypothetical protein